MSARTEKLIKSDYVRAIIEPSQIVEGLKVESEGLVLFMCPKCRVARTVESRLIEHGSHFTCSQCDLHFETYGNRLTICESPIWDDQYNKV